MNIWSNISFTTAVLFLLLACICLLYGENNRSRNYLVFWLFTLTGLTAAPYYNLEQTSTAHVALQTIFYTLANLTPVASTLLVFMLFEEKDVSSPAYWWIAAIAVGLDSFDYWVSQPGNWPNDVLLIIVFEYLPQLVKICYLGLAAYALLSSWKADLVQKRFQLRFVILLAAMAIGMEMLVVENLLAIRTTLPYDPSAFHAGWQFVLAIWLVFTFLQPRSVNWASLKVQKDLPDPETVARQSWFDWDKKKLELDTLFFNSEIYRDPDLNLKSIARELAIPEYRARQLINIELGYKNLNDFLHDHRIAAAARDLADNSKNHLPILTIALEAGYGSLAPFNKAFKERKKQTPSEFRRNALQVNRSNTENSQQKN